MQNDDSGAGGLLLQNSVKQESRILFCEQEFSRKDAKVAKSQRLVRILLCVFAPLASLRETTFSCGVAACGQEKRKWTN